MENEILVYLCGVLQSRIRNLIEEKAEIFKEMLEKNTQMGLLKLLGIYPDKDWDDILLYHCILVVVRYAEESPLYSVNVFNDVLTILKPQVQTNPLLKNSFFYYLQQSVQKEVESARSVNEIFNWIYKISDLASIGMDTQMLNLCGTLKFKVAIGSLLARASLGKEPEAIQELVCVVVKVQKIGIDINSISDVIGAFVCDYIKEKSEKSEKVSGRIIGKLSKMRFANQEIAKRVADLIIKPVVQIENFQDIEKEELLYLDTSDPHMQTSLYRATYMHIQITVKEYQIKEDIGCSQRIHKEAQILSLLSARMSPNNCFLKFFGLGSTKNCFSLAIEYIEETIHDRMVNMNNAGVKFLEDFLIETIRNLIWSYTEMEQFGIYQRDINPHNLFFTGDNKIKIGSFIWSDLDGKKEESFSSTLTYEIKGTHGYISPDLEVLLAEGSTRGKFRKGRSDVFSLGMTILQLVTTEQVYSLTLPENYSNLQSLMATVPYSWCRKLLEKMLNPSYHKRLSFRKLLMYIPNEEISLIVN